MVSEPITTFQLVDSIATLVGLACLWVAIIRWDGRYLVTGFVCLMVAGWAASQ